MPAMNEHRGAQRPVSRYAGSVAALLTKHGKERIIAPPLEEALGCLVEHVAGYDTDLLGTFTREVARPGSQLEAARRKARIGMELSGRPLGISSEGAFGPDPFTGLFAWNREAVIWIDDELGIEVVGAASGKTNFAHCVCAAWDEVEAFARSAGFPEHWLVVRPGNEHDDRIRKGISDRDALREAFRSACKEAENGSAFIETDMRAHANPMRRETIARAAGDLAQKLMSLCPACGSPGFWSVERIPGLPCEECGAPTNETRAEIQGCRKCPHRVTNVREGSRHAPAARCPRCNP